MKVFKSFLLFFFFAVRTIAQCPPNVGFEDGTFTGWECFAGSINAQGIINVNPTAPLYDRHVINSGTSTAVDPYGLFPVACPNGSGNSIKLGNEFTGGGAERITYTYQVPPGSQYTLIFNYAVVLQNPPHETYQQPKFTAKIYDVTDDKYIECPAFDFVASSALPGFQLSNVAAVRGTSVYYKPWAAATINLVGMGGKTIRLEFGTNDCTPGGHFGYAYLDFDENCGAAITGNAYCEGQESMALHAPTGFYQYAWYNGANEKVGSGESLTLTPPPPDLSKYSVEIIPYPGLGCIEKLNTIVNKINADFKFVVKDTLRICTDQFANLRAPEVTAGSSKMKSLTYFSDSLGTVYVYKPEAVNVPGTYYIKGINDEGCQSILPVQVVVETPVLEAKSALSVQYPGTVNLTNAFVPRSDHTYSYFSDAATTKVVDNYLAIDKTGLYHIKATSKSGCDIVAAVQVTITPPPPFTITAPNTFTPNNDGRNDYFALTLEGFLTFGRFTVFNRYGQLMYTSMSQADRWDGNMGGRNLPAGVYYWIFEGTDSYYKTKVTRSASITLLR